ncbi:chemotaxis protein, partial [Mesorhizobium sp. CAU 1741]
AASHNLAQEADELARLVAKFKLGTQADAGRPAAGRAKSAPAPVTRMPARPQPSAPALKTVSSGGGQAAALLASQPEDDGWEEF